jgi:cobalt-zinc-cadmium efflux system protein
MSSEQAGHNHTHDMAKQTLRLAFFLTLLIVAAEVGGGLLAHSLALLSDAGHALTDIFALGLAWFATVQAERPANARKTFGYHRVGICQMEEIHEHAHEDIHPSIAQARKG